MISRDSTFSRRDLWSMAALVAGCATIGAVIGWVVVKRG